MEAIRFPPKTGRRGDSASFGGEAGGPEDSIWKKISIGGASVPERESIPERVDPSRPDSLN